MRPVPCTWRVWMRARPCPARAICTGRVAASSAASAAVPGSACKNNDCSRRQPCHRLRAREGLRIALRGVPQRAHHIVNRFPAVVAIGLAVEEQVASGGVASAGAASPAACPARTSPRCSHSATGAKARIAGSAARELEQLLRLRQRTRCRRASDRWGSRRAAGRARRGRAPPDRNAAWPTCAGSSCGAGGRSPPPAPCVRAGRAAASRRAPGRAA